MLKSFFAFVLVFVITCVGVSPAYASSLSQEFVNNNTGTNNSIIINNYPDDKNHSATDSFISGARDGMLNAAGYAIGGIIVCYAVDGVAATFFPPTAGLSTFCPTVGGLLGGGSKSLEMVARKVL